MSILLYIGHFDEMIFTVLEGVLFISKAALRTWKYKGPMARTCNRLLIYFVFTKLKTTRRDCSLSQKNFRAEIRN